MRQLTLSPRLFATEVQNYSDSRLAIWRELVQNSIDAGATTMEASVEEIEGAIRIRFQDNGRGMSLETLENVFFRLGETGKAEGGDSVGGFGKARILLCFAQKSYSIHTNDCFAHGSGSSFDIAKAPVPINGCAFEIEVETTDPAWTRQMFESSLLKFMSYCQITATLHLNGELVPGGVKRGRIHSKYDWAAVHVTKSGQGFERGALIIRVHGVMMFKSYVGCKAMVILELDPKLSRNVLTSNRDSLVRQYSEVLDDLKLTLSKDTNTGLGLEETLTTTTTPTRRRFSLTDMKGVAVKPKEDAWSMDSLVDAVWSSEAPRTLDLPTPVAQHLFGQRIAGPPPLKPLHPLADGLCQVIESGASKRLIGKAKGWAPEAWTQTQPRLLGQWEVAVWAALRAYAEVTGELDFDYCIGWVFSETTLAAHSVLPDGAHAILLNPIKPNGTRRYTDSSVETLAVLLSKACHEVCHMKERWHDEDYAYLFTRVVARAMADCGSTFKAMRASRP
jgi:hypothetical protein